MSKKFYSSSILTSQLPIQRMFYMETLLKNLCEQRHNQINEIINIRKEIEEKQSNSNIIELPNLMLAQQI